MERTISPEEKIRRAEEIYARRKSGYTSKNIATVNVSQEKDFNLLKKMILQILICLIIYFIYYLIQNSNYIFSENVINKTKEILSYDIDMQSMYVELTKVIKNLSNDLIVGENNQIDNENNNESNEENTENKENENNNENKPESEQNNTQEAEVMQEQTQNKKIEDIEIATKGEVQTDEQYIKANYNFIKPVEGIVSSEFGPRNVDNPIVSKDHKGIDIAANLGTEIKASIPGTVTVSSTTGDYGYHIEIQNQDITTLYAHCSKLDVKQGDDVVQGQIIARVGDTGKATSAHLHFEIKRNDTYINPRDIVEF